MTEIKVIPKRVLRECDAVPLNSIRKNSNGYLSKVYAFVSQSEEGRSPNTQDFYFYTGWMPTFQNLNFNKNTRLSSLTPAKEVEYQLKNGHIVYEFDTMIAFLVWVFHMCAYSVSSNENKSSAHGYTEGSDELFDEVF